MAKLAHTKTRTILFVALLAILAGLLFVQFNGAHVAVDFPSYYYAAKLVFEDGLTPYNNSNWRLVEPLHPAGELFPFLYPPPSLLLMRPFLAFEYDLAQTLMLWLNHVLILAFVYIFFFKILKLKTEDWFLLPAIIFLYAFFPLHLNLGNGQVGLWVLVSVCLAWWATKEKAHPIWIAVPIVIGTVLKIYPIFFLIIHFFKKDYKPIVYTLVLLAVVGAAATLMLPDGIWQDWYAQVGSQGYAEEVRGVMMATPANQSIAAFTTRLFFGRGVRFEGLLRPTAWAAQAPYVLGALAGLASLAATWRLARVKKPEPENLDAQFCIWLLATFLVAPFSWSHHLVHLLPAIFIAVLEAWKRRDRLAMALTIGVAIFLALDFPSNDPFFRRGVWTLLISSQLYAVIFLWAYFIFRAWKTKAGYASARK